MLGALRACRMTTETNVRGRGLGLPYSIMARSMRRPQVSRRVFLRGVAAALGASQAAPLRAWQDGTLRTYRITPEDFGFRRCTDEALQGGTREAAAEIIRAVLAGAVGPCGDIAVLNAAAAIYVGGLAPSIHAGIDRARESVRSGQARHKLQQLIEFTNQ